ncbi:MAG: AzlC family ABC transporter permease [Syntrophomonadaceae bacterium]|nr:AzlC family ABC transporter permease [Syntrophomonadaceae bacterium]
MRGKPEPSFADLDRRPFVAGCQAAVPIAIGYLPIGITFGLLAKAVSIPNHITLMMSMLVLAGASQFVGINLIILGTSIWEIVLTTFVVNLRHLLMSASLAPRVDTRLRKTHRAILAFGITDETFSVASFRPEASLGFSYLLGLNMTSFIAWNLGTWMGLFLATGMPDALKTSMGIALYAMFIGLLVPACRNSRPILSIALTAIVLQALWHFSPIFSGMSMGTQIVLTTIIASFLGAVMMEREEGL